MTGAGGAFYVGQMFESGSTIPDELPPTERTLVVTASKTGSFHRKTSNYAPWLPNPEPPPIFHEGGASVGYFLQ